MMSVDDTKLRDAIQYIKTFAPQRWEKKKNGELVKTLEPFALPADPWVWIGTKAVQRGRELYHFKAECANCHPSYGTKEELYKLSIAANKREPEVFKPVAGFRAYPFSSVAKDSSDYGVPILPPDFTYDEMVSVRPDHEIEDIFRVISYGVYPVMPAWKGSISDEDIWAVAHYVRSLAEMRGTDAATELRNRLAKDPPFNVPVQGRP
jgi:mono/diheme cytochrome c family protein